MPAGSSAIEMGLRLRRRRRWMTVAFAIAVATSLVLAGLGQWTAGAVALVAGGVLSSLRPRDIDRWFQGAEGERATSRLLTSLPARDFVVLHDLRVPGSRANVDHLVIGRSGVWMVDTKAPRVPVRARWRSVWIGERRLDASPAAWEAQVCSDRLGVAVTPLVAVHDGGAGVASALRHRGRRVAGVRVMEASAAVSRIRRRWRPRVLSAEEVADLAASARAIFSPAITAAGG